MSTSVFRLPEYMQQKPEINKAKMSWDSWLAQVLTENGRSNNLSANDLAFLHKRHKEGLRPNQVFI